MARAESGARALHTRLGLGEPPVDLDEVADELGIIVVREESAPDVLGMLLRRAGRVVVGLNPYHSELLQRFALAHLLGHHQLHRDRDVLIDLVDRRPHESLASLPLDREEAEANQFAAALLMPEQQMRRMALETDWSTGTQLVGILAERFKVSRMVMGYRLMQLGILIDC